MTRRGPSFAIMSHAFPFRPAAALALCAACFAAPAQAVFDRFDTDNSGLPYDQVNALAVDAAGALWVGTEFGLGAYDGTGWQTWNSSLAGMPDDVVRSLAVDPDGRRIWAGHFLGGLSRHDPLTGAWDVWTVFDSPLPDPFVRALAFAPDGALWIGTTGGLARYEPGTDAWTTWTTASSDLPANNVPAIHVQEDGTVWIGTINGGLGRFNGKGWDNWTIANSALIDNTILDLDEDADGNLWLATPAGGLALRTPGGSFLILNTLSSDIPDNELACLAVDGRRPGWLGLTSAGLATFDGSDWSRTWTANSNLPEDRIHALWRTAGDTLWVGLESEGLARLAPADTVSGLESPPGSAAVGPNPFGAVLAWLGPPAPGPVAWTLHAADGRRLAAGTLAPGQRRFALPAALPEGLLLLDLRLPDGTRRGQTLRHVR
jgi:ligand-binding sensor domain-containing protein